MNILAIESSCDETACAIVEDGKKLISETIASTMEMHVATGGVVPEIAARKQLEFIIPVINETLEKAQKFWGLDNSEQVIQKIDAIAVTVGPGLIGSLLVGVESAKALALAWKKPLVPVNHLVGHIYGNFVENPKDIEFPALVLIVSGGHTDLVLMKNHSQLEYLGGTLDDAAGEAFDKVARMLGLKAYLGGPEVSKKASECKINHCENLLPRPLIDENNFDFSFSGLKSATKRLIEMNKYDTESICKEFENAVVEVLVKKTIKAAKHTNAKTILLGGGVSANKHLREKIAKESDNQGFNLHIPPLNLCTDNAIYIASAAYFNYKPQSLKEIKADSSLGIMD